MLTMFLFNIAYVFTTPDAIYSMSLGGVVGFIAVIIAAAIFSGIRILGSGLSGASTTIIFGIGSIVNILFSISIAGFQVGLGLSSNMMSVFSDTEFMGLGFITVTVLSVMTLASGVMMVVGGGGGD